MLARQAEECQRQTTDNPSVPTSPSRSFTPLNNDHVQVQHTNVTDSANVMQNNGMIYGSPRNGEEKWSVPLSPAITPIQSRIESSNRSFDSEASSTSSRSETNKPKNSNKSWETNSVQTKTMMSNNYEVHQQLSIQNQNQEPKIHHRQQSSIGNDGEIGFSTLDYGERLKPQPNWSRSVESTNTEAEFQRAPRRVLWNDGMDLNETQGLTC